MLKAVLFDIDNTLYDYDAAHREAYRALTAYAVEALSLSPERFDALHGEASRTLEVHAGGPCAAIHNRLIRYQLMLERVGKPIAHAPRMAELYWSTLINHMEAFPGAAEAFDRIKSMGLTLGIGTNMTADRQFAKLERLGLLGRVDFMVSSEEVSAEKPDGRLFARCAEKAGCPAAACAFVGDSLKGDVLGAIRAGMKAVWFRPGPEPATPVPGAIRICSLTELPELLATL